MKEYIREHYLIILLFLALLAFCFYLNSKLDEIVKEDEDDKEPIGRNGSGNNENEPSGSGRNGSENQSQTNTDNNNGTRPSATSTGKSLSEADIKFVKSYVNSALSADTPTEFMAILASTPKLVQIYRSNNISSSSELLNLCSIVSDPQIISLLDGIIKSA